MKGGSFINLSSLPDIFKRKQEPLRITNEASSVFASNYVIEEGSDLDDSDSEEKTTQNQHQEYENSTLIPVNPIPDVENNIKLNLNQGKIKYNRLRYKDVETKIDLNYFDKQHKYSNSLDILASYLKGQKIIYMESKYYSETQLNKLMMPAILLSTAATVLGSAIQFLTWGAILISAVNGVISFLLTLTNITI